jgi:hypothetical protein
MNGSSTALEEILHRLADGLEAPATPTALRRIEQRTGSLRRRRLVGVAAAVGVVMAATVGGLAVLGDDPPGDEVDVQGSVDESGLPAFTLDLDGWQVITARDELDVPWGIGPPLSGDDSTEALQVFRVPGDAAGPSISVHHIPTDGPVDQLEEDVTIGDQPGRAQVRDGDITVNWQIHDGRTQVLLRAYGLSLDQVLDFAEGLRPKDADIASPPGPGDHFGFDATTPVAGLGEEPPFGARPATVDSRIVRLAKGGADRDRPSFVMITVENVGRRVFEEDLANADGDDWSEVTVDGVPASMLTLGPDYPNAPVAGELTWMVDEVTRVRVTAHRVTRDELTAIAEGIHPISADEWAEILAETPDRVDIPDPPEGLGG